MKNEMFATLHEIMRNGLMIPLGVIKEGYNARILSMKVYRYSKEDSSASTLPKTSNILQAPEPWCKVVLPPRLPDCLQLQKQSGGIHSAFTTMNSSEGRGKRPLYTGVQEPYKFGAVLPSGNTIAKEVGFFSFHCWPCKSSSELSPHLKSFTSVWGEPRLPQVWAWLILRHLEITHHHHQWQTALPPSPPSCSFPFHKPGCSIGSGRRLSLSLPCPSPPRHRIY